MNDDQKQDGNIQLIADTSHDEDPLPTLPIKLPPHSTPVANNKLVYIIIATGLVLILGVVGMYFLTAPQPQPVKTLNK